MLGIAPHYSCTATSGPNARLSLPVPSSVNLPPSRTEPNPTSPRRRATSKMRGTVQCIPIPQPLCIAGILGLQAIASLQLPVRRACLHRPSLPGSLLHFHFHFRFFSMHACTLHKVITLALALPLLISAEQPATESACMYAHGVCNANLLCFAFPFHSPTSCQSHSRAIQARRGSISCNCLFHHPTPHSTPRTPSVRRKMIPPHPHPHTYRIKKPTTWRPSFTLPSLDPQSQSRNSTISV